MQDIDVHSLVSFSLPMINCRVWTWPKPLLPTWLNISLGSCIGPSPNAKYMSFCKEVRCPCSESFPRMNWAHQWTSPLGCCWFQHGHILHPSIPTIKDQVVRSSPWSPPACCCAWSPSATSSETAIYDHWHWAWEPGLVPSRIALESRSVCPLLGPSSTGPSSPWLEFGDRFKHRTQLKTKPKECLDVSELDNYLAQGLMMNLLLLSINIEIEITCVVKKIESWSCQPLSPTTFPTQKSSFCTLGTTNRCNHKQAQTLNNLLNLQRVFSLAFLQLFWTNLKYHVKDKPDVQLVLEVTLECRSPLLLLHLLHDKLSNKEVYKIN